LKPMASSQKPKGNNIDEDVDDLDDLIGQFAAQPAKTPKSAANQLPSTKPSAAQEKLPAVSSSSTPAKSPAASDAFSDEFAQEFAKGMESLLKEIGGEGALDADDELTEEEREKEKAFKSAWESLFMEGIAGTGVGGSKPSSPSTTAKPGEAEDSFQSRIKMTMDKLKESESTLKTDSGSTPDLGSLLSGLGNLGEGGEGDEELQAILETMMSQLMSKDVLYEPLKELKDKFPSYLADNASKLSEADKKRYQSQQECVTKIISVFEDPKHSDDDPEGVVQVVTLMNEMQTYGAPPTEIMGDLPPGINIGGDGLPQLPEGCNLM